MRFRPGRSMRPAGPGGPFRRFGGPPPLGQPRPFGGPMRWGPPLLGPRHPLRAAALQMLAEANQFFFAGNPAAAAPLYAQLAAGAASLGRPRQAVRLNLEAALCYAQLAQAAPALTHARGALALVPPDMPLPEPMQASVNHIIAELRQHGAVAEADALASELQARLGVATGTPPAAATPPQTLGRLPAKCPSCGGTVRSDEVEWIDAHSAECAYCGSTISAT